MLKRMSYGKPTIGKRRFGRLSSDRCRRRRAFRGGFGVPRRWRVRRRLGGFRGGGSAVVGPIGGFAGGGSRWRGGLLTAAIVRALAEAASAVCTTQAASQTMPMRSSKVTRIS
jgi:hypothetical protein